MPAEWLRQDGRRCRRGVELAADARELARYGVGRTQAAERLGVSVDALDRALGRHPAADGEITSVA